MLSPFRNIELSQKEKWKWKVGKRTWSVCCLIRCPTLLLAPFLPSPCMIALRCQKVLQFNTSSTSHYDIDLNWTAELAVGNIIRRVLHIIREEDLSLTTAAIGDLNISVGSDDDVGDDEKHDHTVLSAAAVAAASRSTLRPPSLQTLLEDIPDATAVPRPSSSGGDTEGKSKCKLCYRYM